MIKFDMLCVHHRELELEIFYENRKNISVQKLTKELEYISVYEESHF